MKPAPAIFAVSLALTGCANTLIFDPMLSKKSMLDSTALALHQPASAIIVADRRYDGVAHTSYTAWTPHGAYNCVINDGSVSALKPTDPPHCSPQ